MILGLFSDKYVDLQNYGYIPRDELSENLYNYPKNPHIIIIIELVIGKIEQKENDYAKNKNTLKRIYNSVHFVYDIIKRR